MSDAKLVGGPAALRAWRLGEWIGEAERRRREQACRSKGVEPTVVLSQEDAAAHLGCSQSALSTYETGDSVPRVPMALQIDERTGGYVPVRAWLPSALVPHTASDFAPADPSEAA